MAASLSLLLGSALMSVGQAAITTPQAYVSSLDGVYQLSEFTVPTLNNANNPTGISSTWSGTVNDGTSGYRQNITGFGACVTDATVDSFKSLPGKQYKQLLQDLFSTETGIGMSLMRHTIGASDLSNFTYSYDDSDTPDLKLKHFGLTSSGRMMTNVIADMVAVNPNIKLLGSVWSPPGWMKDNGVMDGNATGNTLNMSYSEVYAQYLTKYVQQFQRRGVHVDALTLQNEPLNSNPGYPTSILEAADEASIIQQYLGPMFKQNNISTQIWAYDHNTDRPDYPQTVLNNAGDYVNTVAWHCYANPLDWSVLDQFRANNTNVTGLTQYMTECWLSPLTSWYQSIYYILQPLQHWSSGSIGWTLGTTNLGPHLPGGCNTCRGIVTVDDRTNTYDLTMDYYFFGQFSKYMARGAQVLATTGSYDFGSGSACEYTATLNADGSRTVVIYNGFGNYLYITLTFASGESWSGPLYQYSLTTWVLPPTTGTVS